MTRNDRNWLIGSAITGVALFGALMARGDSEPIDWRRWQYRNQPQVYEAASAWIAARDTFAQARVDWVHADSRARVPHDGRPGADGLIVRVDAGLAPSLREGAEMSLRTEFARHGIDAAAHPIAVVLMVDTILNPGGRFYERATVLPRTASDPCTVVVRFSRPVQRWNRSAGQERLLGPCAFFAKYGTPGAGMNAYLRASAMRTAEYLQTPTPWIRRETLMPAAVARTWPALAGCRAGHDASCLELFEGRLFMTAFFEVRGMRATDIGSDVTVDGPLTHGGYYDRLSSGLLAELARTMGDERFARLWRDARAPAEAYEAITGEPVAEWMGRVVASEVAPYRPGPTVPAVPLAASLFVLGGASLLALRGTRRSLS